MQKEDTTCPTLSIQGLVFSQIIDSKEDMDVATEEIPGYFLQADDTSGSTNLKFDGMMAELLVPIDQYIHRK